MIPAEAACVDGTPTNCSGGGPQDVCLVTTVFNPNDTITCNLDRNGGGNGSDVHAITNGLIIEVFGDDAAGNTFCCELAPGIGAPIYMSINGDNSNIPDRVDLSFGLLDELKNPNVAASTPGDMTCNVFTGDGDDTIIGSNESTQYSETLSGGDGDDTITGRGGADMIGGNDGDDDLYGGSDDDVIRGGAGNDDLFGGAGDDALIGDLETGAGAHGVDELFGGSGDDVLCSGGKDSYLTGVEVLEGDDDDDIIWTQPRYASSTLIDSAAVDGGTDSGFGLQDQCGPAGGLTNCESPVTTTPHCW